MNAGSQRSVLKRMKRLKLAMRAEREGSTPDPRRIAQLRASLKQERAKQEAIQHAAHRRMMAVLSAEQRKEVERFIEARKADRRARHGKGKGKARASGLADRGPGPFPPRPEGKGPRSVNRI